MKPKTTSESPATIDELVHFIAERVSELHQKSGQRMDGSMLAYTIRTEYPKLDYTDLGLIRMGDAVRIAEKKGLVEKNRTVNHLELMPPSASQESNDTISSSQTPEKKYVRNDIWKAFVFRTQSAKFIDRATSRVIETPLGQPTDLNANRKSERLLEIERIPDETQIAWAKQFVKSSTSTDECSDEDARALAFAKDRRFSASMVRSWKSFMSSKVVDTIRAWAAENDIETDEILVPVKHRHEAGPSRETIGNDPKLRKSIMAAINDMQTSELDELAIPVKYIRRHFVAK